MEQLDKQKLLQKCKYLVQYKLEDTQRMIDEIRVASADDTKSTAGDKHETGRAMSHLEIEKLQSVMASLSGQAQTLENINPSRLTNQLELGAIVETSGGVFFLSAPLGRLELDGQEVWAIGMHAPLIKTLEQALKSGDGVFNGKTYRIARVY